MGELWFRIRDFFRYTKMERRDLMLSILVVTFAFAFDDKQQSFELVHWTLNFLFVYIIVAVAFFAHTGIQKVSALQQGYIAEYKTWPLGLAITVIVTLITGGKWYVLLFGGITIVHVPILRIGKWRYGLNMVAQGTIAALGAFGNLIIATFCYALGNQAGIMPEFFIFVASINFWILLYSLLPIPRMDGIHLFFVSRLAYVFVLTTLISYFIMAKLNFYSWIFAFLIGVVCWFLFYIYFEK